MKKLLYVGMLTAGLFASGCGGSDKNTTVAADDYGVPSPTAPTIETSPMMSETASPMMTGNASPSPWNSEIRAKVAVGDTSIGKVLTGKMGRTLYLFEKDKNGKSACSSVCAGAWPPYITVDPPEAGAGARANLLGTTRRDDGSMQVTYNKHPLYYYAQDTKAGDTLGHDIEAFGAEWYAVTPDGRKVH